MGTLGVEGAANLFLLNPNGIIFGPNAQLDIRGSFLATTAHNFTFPDGSEFSAVAPQAPPLLTLNVPIGLQYGSHPAGTITNQGNLAVGQDLTLAAHTLDVQGQLQAGRNLTLHAQDTLQVRDSAMHPFLSTAGNQMLLQGDRTVEIATLNHPDSRFSAGTDLILRSANPITGNAHFHAGRDVRIEHLDSSLGNLFSPQHAMMRAGGDVRLHSYNGASLHILAGGSVAIAGDMTITGTDATGHAPVEQVVLSDGSRVAIDGTRRPTLDIRAGTTAVGTAGSRGDNSAANITVGGTIRNPGGDVLLTNQYQARGQPRGAIAPARITTHHIDTSTTLPEMDGGEITLDGRGRIQTGNLNSSTNVSATAGSVNAGNGGDIRLLASNGGIRTGNIISSSDIVAESSTISDSSFAAGDGGDIHLYAANGDIRTRTLSSASSLGAGSLYDLSTISDSFLTTRDGGAIRLYAANGSIRTGDLNSTSVSEFLFSASPASATFLLTNSSFQTGNGGEIYLQAANGDIDARSLRSESVSFLDFDTTSSSNPNSLASTIFSITNSSFQAGDGGAIYLQTTQGDIHVRVLTSRSFLNLSVFSVLDLSDTFLSDSLVFSVSNSWFQAGEGGDIQLQATYGDIHTDYLISSSASSLQAPSVSNSLARSDNGGEIQLQADGDIRTGDLSSSSDVYLNPILESPLSEAAVHAGDGGVKWQYLYRELVVCFYI